MVALFDYFKHGFGSKKARPGKFGTQPADVPTASVFQPPSASQVETAHLLHPGDFGTPNNPFDKDEEREQFGLDMLADLLSGAMVLHVQSSWLTMAVYRPEIQALGVAFQDGFQCTYMNVTRDEARDFFTAPSKGKWIWARMHGGFQVNGRHWIHTHPFHPGSWPTTITADTPFTGTLLD